MVQNGVDVLLQQGCAPLSGRRYGLITNHTGLDATMTSTVDRLANAPTGQLVALFGPEHGIRGDVAEGESVASGQDSRSGLPVYSLYGDTYEPRPEWLVGLDALVFDIQDLGVRFYTYTQTMFKCMVAAGRLGLEFFVLDRPNPLGGLICEGTLVEPGFTSMVGLNPVATRYGLTIGELARLYVTAGWVKPAPKLTVIQMAGWRRNMDWEATGQPWVPPSPAAPSSDMAFVYPGTCLFEGTNISEGRGTNRPFEIFGAPFIDGWQVRQAAGEIPGALLRPLVFRPLASKHAGQVCGGVQIHVTDRQVFRPYATGLSVFETLLKLYPHDLIFNGEYPGNYFDLLQGTDRVRRALLAGKSTADVLAEWAPRLAAFDALRQEAMLYHE